MALIAFLVLAVPGLFITIIHLLRKNNKGKDTDRDTDKDTAGSEDPRSNTSNKSTEI
ncbi:Uncharacterised protein [Corynebacterium jeikeium]|nr:Uncharacterised protein [Corynebacterium jeikeium]